jgi:accessory gene regulator protein AgrB
MIIGKLSESLAIKISEHNNRPDVSIIKLKLGLHLILNYLLVFITAIIFSIFFENTSDVIPSFFMFALLRTFSGGSWHFKNDFHCYLFSSVVMIILPLINLNNNYVDVNYITLLLILILAPVSIRVERTSKKGIIFKIISLLIVAVNLLIFKSPAITSVLLFQGLSLIKIKRGN